MYKQPPQCATLLTNIPKKLWDLPNNNAENKNNIVLSNILLSLRDLLKVFLNRQAHILLHNSKYNYAIDWEKGKQPFNFFYLQPLLQRA